MKKTVIILIHFIAFACIRAFSLFFLAFPNRPTVVDWIAFPSLIGGLTAMDYIVCRSMIRRQAIVFDKPVLAHTADFVLLLIPLFFVLLSAFDGFDKEYIIWLAVIMVQTAVQIMLRIRLIKLNHTVLVTTYLPQ